MFPSVSIFFPFISAFLFHIVNDILFRASLSLSTRAFSRSDGNISTRDALSPQTQLLFVCVCVRVCVSLFFVLKKKNKEETFFKVLFLCRIEVAAGTLAFYFSVRLTRFTLDLIFRFVSTRSSLARKIHFFLSLFLTDASSLSLCVSLSEHVVSRIVLLYADELDLYGNPIHPERDMFPHSLPTHTSTTCIYIYIFLFVCV